MAHTNFQHINNICYGTISALDLFLASHRSTRNYDNYHTQAQVIGHKNLKYKQYESNSQLKFRRLWMPHFTFPWCGSVAHNSRRASWCYVKQVHKAMVVKPAHPCSLHRTIRRVLPHRGGHVCGKKIFREADVAVWCAQHVDASSPRLQYFGHGCVITRRYLKWL